MTAEKRAARHELWNVNKQARTGKAADKGKIIFLDIKNRKGEKK